MNFNKLKSALGRKFSFSIANSGGTDKVVYILNGFLKGIIDFDVTQSTSADYEVTAIEPQYTRDTPLTNMGLPSGSVLDDGTFDTDMEGTASLSTLKIRQFKEQIKFYPQACTKLTIAVDNNEQFDENIYLGSIDVMKKQATEYALTVSEFFDRYQNQGNKVEISFREEPLILEASTFMYLTVRDGRTITFTFNFQ